MNRIFAGTYLFMLLHTQALPQADSLIQLLSWHKADTTKVWIYRDIAYYLKPENPDSAIYYATKGYDLAKQLQFSSGMIWNLNQAALAWTEKSNLDSADAYFSTAIQLSYSSGDTISAGNLLNSIGINYYFQGNFSKAIQYYDSSLSLFDRLNYNEGMARSLNNLGIIYRIRRNYNKALEIYRRSLKIKEFLGDSTGIAVSHYNLGYAFTFLNDQENSLKHFTQAADIYKKLNNQEEVYKTSMGKGAALYNLGEFDEAYKELRFAIDHLTHKNSLEYIQAVVYLGAVLMHKDSTEKGIAYMEKGYAAVENSGRIDLLKNISFELSRAYEQTGDYKKAAYHWKNHSILFDSLSGEQKQWAIEEMQARFDTREKENMIQIQQIELLRQEDQKKLYLITAILAVLLFTVSIVFAVKQYKLRKYLQIANNQIKITLEEKDSLMKEIHHRVKNNLQMVSSILSIQSREISDQKALEAVNASKTRVQSMGLIHQFLYGEGEFRSIQMAAYVKNLTAYLLSAYCSPEKEVKIHTEIEELYLDVDTAIPLGLILNELITNSIKHAFREKSQGSVYISLKKTDGILKLKVMDDGAGFDLSRPEKNSFGLTLLETLAKRLKAEMHIDSSQGTSIEYSIANYHLHSA
ncbi:MAG: tetratricopeptide repeat protein [Cyclobacteriaceae bacterium]|nr:tetratricopeptide repeat protein [Cyclobacteriaceae bacterium]